MAYETRIDPVSQIAYMTIRGEAKLPELVEAVAALSPKGKYVSNKRLWDLREMIVSVTPDELELLARSALIRDTRKDARVAIVAEEGLTFRLSKMFEIYRGSDSVGVRAFKDEQAAVEWLMQET